MLTLNINRLFTLVVIVCAIILGVNGQRVRAAEESGSVGIEGKISAPAPTTPASISVPGDGATFTTIPITVSGICPQGLLVKLFKNNVFAGAVQCSNGSFSITLDLFSGRNELVARVFDDLDQAGPDSNIVAVNFTDTRQGTSARVSLTSNYAKRGANPGQTLVWPVILSGGSGPYAISVDWGDGKAPDLMSQQFPGTLELKHVYDNPGAYNIIVKASDKDGGVAYLQLVGIANGSSGQVNTASASTPGSGQNSSTGGPQTKLVWQPAAILIPFIFMTFWLGKRHELRMMRKKIEQGVHPFK